VGLELSKVIKPKKDEEIVKYFDYYSKYKNTWIYKIVVTKKKNYYSWLLYYYGNSGIKAITVMADTEDYMFFFTTHFFKRYNERRKLNHTLPLDTLRSFMGENHNFNMQFVEDLNEGVQRMFCYINSGVILGTADHNIKLYWMNTFLTNDMLKSDQLELAEQLKNYHLEGAKED
jgi:hypothetical protein